jgi:hypothetical protein
MTDISSKPPSSVEEYLALVREEASSLPDVFLSERGEGAQATCPTPLRNLGSKVTQGSPVAVDDCTGKWGWAEEVSSQFRIVRQKAAQWPELYEAEVKWSYKAWKNEVLGARGDAMKDGARAAPVSEPSELCLRGMDQITIRRILRGLVDDICGNGFQERQLLAALRWSTCFFSAWICR